MLLSQVVVMREVLRGLGEFSARSSSSRLRLRLEDRFRVFGSMFSASSMKMEVFAEAFAEKAAPGLLVVWSGMYEECTDHTILLVLTVQFGPHQGVHPWRIQAGKGLARGSHGESSHDDLRSTDTRMGLFWRVGAKWGDWRSSLDSRSIGTMDQENKRRLCGRKIRIKEKGRMENESKKLENKRTVR